MAEETERVAEKTRQLDFDDLVSRINYQVRMFTEENLELAAEIFTLKEKISFSHDRNEDAKEQFADF